MLEELSKADVIVVMATEANLSRFPYGFIDRAYETLTQNKMESGSLISWGQKEKEIQRIMKSVDVNPEWKAKVVQKALDRKISYEEMLKLDAIWIWENKRK